MFVLIILISMYDSSQNSSVTQIEFNTKLGCETAANKIIMKRHVREAFCVQTDK